MQHNSEATQRNHRTEIRTLVYLRPNKLQTPFSVDTVSRSWSKYFFCIKLDFHWPLSCLSSICQLCRMQLNHHFGTICYIRHLLDLWKICYFCFSVNFGMHLISTISFLVSCVTTPRMCNFSILGQLYVLFSYIPIWPFREVIQFKKMPAKFHSKFPDKSQFWKALKSFMNDHLH